MSDAEPVEEEGPPKRPLARSADLLGRKNSKLRRELDKLYDTIVKGWQDQADRSDNQMDWWDCFHCKLNARQFYNGNAAIYVPIVRDALNARATRFVNQLFPNSGRFVEVVSADGKQPADIIALLDHYIRRLKLKTKIAKPLSLNGDIEGQYNLYVDWSTIERWVVNKLTHGPMLETPEGPVETEGEEIEDIGEEHIEEGLPALEVLHDSDVLVLPQTSDSVDEALEKGGCVVIARRWSKENIQTLIDAKEINDKDGADLLDEMTAAAGGTDNLTDAEKKLAEAVGIRAKGAHATGWEVWKKIPLSEKGEFDEDGDKRLCRIYFGPSRRQLGAKRNPYWNDLCPLLSEPVIKVAGVFKGPSLVEPVAPLQYEANDAANEGADSSHYAAMPLMRVDPEVTQPIILNLGAILKAAQGQIEMITFPDLTGRAVTRIQMAIQQIFQTLGVNPAMLPQQTSQKKPNQAEIAQHQAVDLLMTAEAVTVMEQGIFTPLVAWFVDLDHQFRQRDLTVRMFGTLGKHAEVQQIPPLQNRTRYQFLWLGAELARNTAQLQQMFMGINVLRGMRQDLMAEGYRLRLGPVLEIAAMSMFGALPGAMVIEDMRHQSSLDPELENQLLSEGHEVPVQPLDQDAKHIQSHMQAAQQSQDPFGHFKLHIAAHIKQMQLKVAAQAQQALQQTQPQPQGGGQRRPGQANGSRQGAAPAGPRNGVQGPPGMIHRDQLSRAGATTMPRKI